MLPRRNFASLQTISFRLTALIAKLLNCLVCLSKIHNDPDDNDCDDDTIVDDSDDNACSHDDETDDCLPSPPSLRMTHQLSGQNLPTIEMSLAIQNVLYVLIEISMARQSLLLIHCGNVLLEF